MASAHSTSMRALSGALRDADADACAEPDTGAEPVAPASASVAAIHIELRAVSLRRRSSDWVMSCAASVVLMKIMKPRMDALVAIEPVSPHRSTPGAHRALKSASATGMTIDAADATVGSCRPA